MAICRNINLNEIENQKFSVNFWNSPKDELVTRVNGTFSLCICRYRHICTSICTYTHGTVMTWSFHSRAELRRAPMPCEGAMDTSSTVDSVHTFDFSYLFRRRPSFDPEALLSFFRLCLNNQGVKTKVNVNLLAILT